MKKIITSLLVAAMLLSFSACGEKDATNKNDETTKATEATTTESTTAPAETESIEIQDEEITEAPEESETEENTEPEEETAYWVVGSIVDEFGDPTGKKFMQGIFADGNYSDSLTSYGSLLVRMAYNTEYNYFEANLIEKGDKQMNSVLHPTTSDMKFLYKIGEEKYQTYWVTALDTTGPLAIDFQGTDSVANNITTALRNGENVSCIIYIDNAKYNFTMYASGFAEAEAEMIN